MTIGRRIGGILVFFAVVATAHGATRNVNNAAGCSDTTGNPYCTINAAILAAASGDSIQIAAGTYAGTIASFSKSLTFTGAGLTTAGTVISTPVTYTGTGPLSMSNLRITSANSNLKLIGTGNFSGLTLTNVTFVGNGHADHGLFIKQNGTVSNVTVTNCASTNHGQSGMLIQPGTGSSTDVDHVTVTGSTFDSNGEYALRIDPRVTTLTVSSSNLTNNAIDGLVLLNASGVTLTNLTITGNRNGILFIPLASPQAIANVTMTNVNASSNTKFISGQYGSGLNLSGGSGPISQISITGSTFSSNGIHGVVTGGAVSQVTIDCGVIASNVQNGIHEASSPSAQLIAKHIYWGCTTGPNTTGCSTVTGNVAYLPFRTTATATCSPQVDLALTKTGSPEPVTPGGSLTYTLTATNNGPDPATGVAITDTLPSSVTFVSAASGCTLNGATVTCTIGNLAPSGQAQRTITVTAPSSPSTITNTASVQGNETPDPNTANNTASFASHVQSAVSLTRIAVFPANISLTPTETFQLAATGYYSDGTTQNLTSQATWSTSAAGVATVNASGLVTGVAQGSAIITASSSGTSGASTAQVENLPVDPTSVATPIDPTKITTIFDATAFLYTGATPIQTGVVAGTIDQLRAAVVRGRVLRRNGQPMPGVHVSVLNHTEYGQTLTRADGRFDLAVNGGGQLTIHLDKNGYISADRMTMPSWNNFASIENVTMIPYDTAGSAVSLPASGMRVARGSTSSDTSGSRTATLLVPSGTTATMTLPNGTTQAMTTLTVRASEFTIGTTGPDAMPAKLPPQSGYTYCVDLSADEALAANASHVDFSTPLPFYIENFLGMPVGAIVPVASYDRNSGVWVPGDNGKVVQIVAIQLGTAYLDTNGDGLADDQQTLAALGITDAERQTLASMYGVGQSLWRVTVSHFSWFDMNNPYGPPDGSIRPMNAMSAQRRLLDNCANGCGSMLGVENQSLGEHVPITGTTFTLNYDSSRMPGRTDNSILTIPLINANVPAPLKRITLDLSIVGVQTHLEFAPSPNAQYVFAWDGKDAYNRTLQGAFPLNVRIGYVYPLVYRTTDQIAQAFGTWGTGGTDVVRADGEITLFQSYDTPLAAPMDWISKSINGWDTDVHHFYDPSSHTLFYGDGRHRTAEGIGSIVTTIAGAGTQSDPNYSGPAADAILQSPRAVAVAPDGTIYISEFNRIRRIDRIGNISTLNITESNGAPASIVADDIVVATDGSLYVSDPNARVVRRIQNGVITTVAGTGGTGDSPDGIPASTANLRPLGIFLDPAGNLLIATGDRVREVRPTGIIQALAGNGTRGYAGDGGVATQAQLIGPSGVVQTPTGEILVTSPDGTNVRLIETNGRIQTILSGPDSSFGSGGPADFTPGIALRSDGTLLVGRSSFIYVVTRDGLRTPIAGKSGGDTAEGAAATAADLGSVKDIALAPDGSLYYVDNAFNRIRRIKPLMPGLTAGDIVIPAADATQLYVFDAVGRHLRTVDTLTNVTIYTFTYDGQGHLAGIVDRSGNTMIIERTGSTASAVVAPGGQRTTLSVAGSGYLGSSTNPAGEMYQFAYSAGGLLTGVTTPNTNSYTFTYDGQGRLTRDQDPVGGFTQLSLTGGPQDFQISRQSGEGVLNQYHVQVLGENGVGRTLTDSAGGVTTTSTTNATITSSGPILSVNQVLTADARFGMLAPYTSTVQATSGGTNASIFTTRTLTAADPTNPLSPTTSATWNTTINGRSYSNAFDASTRTMTASTPAGRLTTTQLSSDGRISSIAIPGYALRSFQYDTHGRLSSMTFGSRAWTFGYDTGNRLITATDPAGRAANYTYDTADRITATTITGALPVQFGYDHDSNPIALTPPMRPAHTFTFDSRDLIASYTPPGGGSTQYAYNKDRQLTLITRPDAKTIALAYDSAGRPSVMTLARGAMHYNYESVTGNLSSITTPDGGALQYTYDGAVPVTATASGPVSSSVTWAYDSDLVLTSEAVGCPTATSLACQPVSFSYDLDKLLTNAGALTLTRDVQTGLITRTSIANGAFELSETLAYNSFGERTSHSATFDVNTLFDEQLNRDGAGRVGSKTETIGGVTTTYAYTYDAVGRLSTVTTNGAVTSYVYDANGNRISRITPAGSAAGTYDDQDRLLTYAGTSYTYGANGELLSKTDTTGTTTYDYDEVGNLLRATLPNGNQIDYVIDGEQRRVGKKVNGAIVQRLVYSDRLRVVAALDGNGDVLARFVYGSRPHSPDLIIKGDTTYRVIADYLGSPRLIVNVNDGSVAERLDYDEYGNITNDTNPGFQPFGFAGGLYDSDTKLIRFGARDYDPQIGRFTSKDPKLFAGGDTSLYAYVVNDPINFIDPLGTDWLDSTSNAIAGFGDTVSLGASRWAREKISHALFGQGSGVDRCSNSYKVGQIGGVLWWTAFGGAVGDEIAGANLVEKELGNITLKSAAEYGDRLAGLTEAEKLAELGGPGGAVAEALSNAASLRWYGQVVKTTFTTGPTPGGWGGLAGVGVGTASYFGNRPSCGCQ